jgi:peroxiredoxin Q/BCP
LIAGFSGESAEIVPTISSSPPTDAHAPLSVGASKERALSASDLIHQLAPEFELESTEGVIRLSELRGRIVVLYFFPKADTPGCTLETCAFRDLKADFDAMGATLLGISRDTLGAQRKFSEKYHVTFPLLADPTEATCQAYHVIADKKMFGRTFKGIERTTFVIDADGRVIKVYPKVRALRHASAVLDDLRRRAGVE